MEPQKNKVGAPKAFNSPEHLWSEFEEYVKYESGNAMYKTEYVGKEGTAVQTKLNVPITFEGFECYLADKKIINDLGDYSSNKNEAYTEFSTIITRIRKNCFVQNFKGASVGLFNANLIAKKLGLIEKVEQNINATVSQITGMEVK